MVYEITKTYRTLVDTDKGLAEVLVAEARHELKWEDEDVVALNVVEVPMERGQK